MHTSTTMKTAEFGFSNGAEELTLAEAVPGITGDDRIGVVVTDPGGGVVAAPLVLAAVGAFYERLHASGEPFYLYPELFVFHVGELHGYHGWLDVWPERREVVVDRDPEMLLGALNDRGITVLLIPDLPPADGVVMRESAESASRRFRSVLRVGGARGPDTVAVTPSPAAEQLISLAAQASAGLIGEERARELGDSAGRATEYTPIDTDTALAMMCGIGLGDALFGLSEPYRVAHGADEQVVGAHDFHVRA